MRRQLEELRQFHGLSDTRTIEEWEAFPAALRDPLAARAFLAEWGNLGNALIRLGFPPMNKLPPDKVHLYKDYAARVFDTPGVQAILKRDLSRIDLERDAMLSRLSWIALSDEDGQSVRAIDLLAKVCGWYWHPPQPSAPATADVAELFRQTNGDAA
jgi:hypothetical protein